MTVESAKPGISRRRFAAISSHRDILQIPGTLEQLKEHILRMQIQLKQRRRFADSIWPNDPQDKFLYYHPL